MLIALVFQFEPFIRIYGNQVLKRRAVLGFFRGQPVYFGNIQQREYFFALFDRTGLAAYQVAGAQTETAYLCNGDVYVPAVGKIVYLKLGCTQKTIAVVMHVQYSATVPAFSAVKHFGYGGIGSAVFFVVIGIVLFIIVSIFLFIVIGVILPLGVAGPVVGGVGSGPVIIVFIICVIGAIRLAAGHISILIGFVFV